MLYIAPLQEETFGSVVFAADDGPVNDCGLR